MRVLNTRRGRRTLLLALLTIAFGGEPVAAQFGELPPGQLSRTEQGLTSELVFYMAFDPATVKDQLPAGLRFRTLREYQGRNLAITEYLRLHPERADWARGYIEIMRADSYAVDGHRARFGARGGMAVWYGYVAPTDTSDARLSGIKMLGNFLALGTWLPDAKLVRYMKRKGFPASAAEVRYWQDAKGIYGSVRAPGLKLTGTCRPQGQPEREDFPVPAYVTVWTPRTVADTFELLTGYGSQEQKCVGAKWQAAGSHPLAGVFRARAQGVEGISLTKYSFGYVLRTALYRKKLAHPMPTFDLRASCARCRSVQTCGSFAR